MDECDHGLPSIPRLSEDDLRCKQREDPEINEGHWLSRVQCEAA